MFLQDVFQCVLVSDNQLSFIIFHYSDDFLEQEDLPLFNDTEFEGSGLGNSSNTTVAGINAGDGRFESIDIENDIPSSSNVNVPGVWMYQTNERDIIYPSKKLIIC